MKYRILFLLLFLSSCLCANGQTTSATPQQSNNTQNNQNNNASPAGGRRAPTIDSVREVDEAFAQLRMLEVKQTQEPIFGYQVDEATRRLYRKPGKEEMRILSPTQTQFDTYSQFLRLPDTGLIKLNADSTCAGDPKVVVAKEDCLKYTMPGAGTAYSFRTESHRMQRLSDITLSKDILKSDGILQHGILVNLGDIPLENINLESKGIKYLADFKPLTDTESLGEYDKQLLKGIKADGYVYGVGVYAKNQTTYALRSIAYKGKVLRSTNGYSYNEFDFDKRKDVIVVFRIIDQDPDGNVTLIWKMLAHKDSPTLKLKEPNKEPNKDKK